MVEASWCGGGTRGRGGSVGIHRGNVAKGCDGGFNGIGGAGGFGADVADTQFGVEKEQADFVCVVEEGGVTGVLMEGDGPEMWLGVVNLKGGGWGENHPEGGLGDEGIDGASVSGATELGFRKKVLGWDVSGSGEEVGVVTGRLTIDRGQQEGRGWGVGRQLGGPLDQGPREGCGHGTEQVAQRGSWVRGRGLKGAGSSTGLPKRPWAGATGGGLKLYSVWGRRRANCTCLAGKSAGREGSKSVPPGMTQRNVSHSMLGRRRSTLCSNCTRWPELVV